MVKYTVDGVDYNSKAALQREWRSKVQGLQKRNRRGVQGKRHPARLCVTGSDANFFVEAAFLFQKQRRRLYPADSGSLVTCKASTTVFIDKAGIAFGRGYRGKQVSKYLAKATCVFFGSTADSEKFRAVSSTLGDDPAPCSVNESQKAPGPPSRKVQPPVAAWLRREIQHQIDRYRKEQKKGILTGAYKCALCARTLGKVESHVDHGTGASSFKAISERFQEEKMLRSLRVADIGDAVTGKLWRNYHLRQATLSMTCKDCNLRNK